VFRVAILGPRIRKINVEDGHTSIWQQEIYDGASVGLNNPNVKQTTPRDPQRQYSRHGTRKLDREQITIRIGGGAA